MKLGCSMRINTKTLHLLQHLERQYIADPTAFVALGYDFDHATRHIALKNGWIEAQGKTTARVYRITRAGMHAMGQNADGFMRGEPMPADEDYTPRPEGEGDLTGGFTPSAVGVPLSNQGGEGQATRITTSIISAPVGTDHLEREITRLRDHNIALFSLLVSTHSLAATLLLKLLSSHSPESSKLVARFEELGAKIEGVTR